MTRKPSVCFVALNCYNLLSGRGDLLHVGGAERQQWLLANWLADQGFRITFVTLDHGQPEYERLGKFEVFSAYKPASGLPVIRFFHPRWSGLARAMRRADCDIYYQRGAGLETGQVAIWCNRNEKKFLFAAANEHNFLPELPTLQTHRERWLYRKGLQMADGIVVQTQSQLELLGRNFQRSATIVGNCVNLGFVPPEKGAPGQSVLWVGRISAEKRFDWLLDVAQRCGNLRFDVVGGANADSERSKSLEHRAASLANIRMNGRVPYAAMPEYYARCRVLCLTSRVEGFPNVLLEAWSQGIPVVTTFDPDGLVASRGLGWVCTSVDDCAAALQIAMTDDAAWQRASEAARDYCLRNHSLDEVGARLEAALSALAADSARQ
jgi:glycosyltransferase involved in cell wall biosynthesis